MTGETPGGSGPDFQDRLAAAQAARRETEPKGDAPRSPMGLAFRIGVDLVAAIVVGTGIGWLLDEAFGSFPVFAIALFFLGGAAGVMNVMRVAKAYGLAGEKQGGSAGGGSD